MNLSKKIDQIKPQANTLALWWLGQSGYVFKTSYGLTIAIDPCLSGKMEGTPEEFPRLFPPPMLPGELKVDVLFITHTHEDHLDLAVLAGRDKESMPTVVCPPSVARRTDEAGIKDCDIRTLPAGKSESLDGLQSTATFCIPNEESVLDSVGFVIKFEDGITVYHTGDTDFHPLLYYLSRFDIDLLMPPINGKYGNMEKHGAAELTRYLRPKVVIPQHYGMFALNNENPHDFVGCLKKSFAESETAVLSVSDTYIYSKVPIQGDPFISKVND